jgi:methylglutaconyl-CoA hydratase
VQGSAYGGALGIIAASDIVLAEHNTKFCFSEVRLGLAPSTIMPYVLQRIGSSNASRLFFTAKLFDATEAKSIGLADLLVDAQNAEESLIALVDNILKASPNAIIECKRMLQACAMPVSGKLIRKSIKSIARLKSSADGQEGLKAFFEKRAPVWR